MVPLARFWYTGGHLREGLMRLEDVLGRADAIPERDKLLAHYYAGAIALSRGDLQHRRGARPSRARHESCLGSARFRGLGARVPSDTSNAVAAISTAPESTTRRLSHSLGKSEMTRRWLPRPALWVRLLSSRETSSVPSISRNSQLTWPRTRTGTQAWLTGLLNLPRRNWRSAGSPKRPRCRSRGCPRETFPESAAALLEVALRDSQHRDTGPASGAATGRRRLHSRGNRQRARAFSAEGTA